MTSFGNLVLSLWLLLLIGCGGGGTSTLDPLPQAACVIEGIQTSHELAPGTPGYAGDELTITVEVSGETPTDIVWDFGGGAIPFGDTQPASPRIELGLPGEYTLNVTITDRQGLTDSMTFAYRVLPESHRIRGIRPSHPAGFATKPVRFVVDVDGEIEVATWTFLDGGATPAVVTSDSPFVQLGEPGEHLVQLEVTLKQGPTITRTLPFTVVANPWQEARREPGLRFIQSLVFSDGGLGVLFLDEEVPGLDRSRLVLLLAQPDEVQHPEEWLRHDLDQTPNAPNAQVLVEHRGQLGIGYVQESSLGEGYFSGVPVILTSATLYPSVASELVKSAISWLDKAHSISLVGNPSGGWLTAFAGEQLTYWGTTGAALPALDDWVIGAMETFPEAPWPQFQLAVIDDALILSTLRSEDATTLQVGRPANFHAVMNTTGYELPGTMLELRTSGDRLVAPLVDAETAVVRIAHTDKAPLAVSDWTIDALGMPATRDDGLSVSTHDGMLYATFEENLLSGRSFSLLRFRTRPLLEPTAAWTEEIVTVDDWDSQFVVPTSGDPIMGWIELGSTGGLVLATNTTE